MTTQTTTADLMDRALRAYFRNSRGIATMQPAASLSEVITTNGRTEVHLRNGPHGLLARYIICQRANAAGLITERLRSVPIGEAA